MRRFVKALALSALLAPTAVAHATPVIPDFDSYPESETHYTIVSAERHCGAIHVCWAFRTPSGFLCAATPHFDFRYLVCEGPKPGDSDVTLTILDDNRFFRESPRSDPDATHFWGVWDEEPVQQLALGQRTTITTGGDPTICITDETWLLACGVTDPSRQQIRGFAITRDGYYSFSSK